MTKTLLIALASASLGVAAALTLTGLEDGNGAPGAEGPSVADLERRIAALEQRLNAFESSDFISESVQAAVVGAGDSRLAEDSEPVAEALPLAAAASERRASRRGRRSPEARRSALLEEGFDVVKTEWIMEREAQLRMDAIRMRYQARRDPGSVEGQTLLDAQAAFRAELGEQDYEKYLRATGRPTRVMVSDVIATSPAEAAGLKQGDLILSYGGERVFNMGELMQRTFEGVEGQLVAVEVEREGVVTQIYIPRGPLGINGVGRRR